MGNGEVWTYTWDPFDKLTDVKLNGVLVYHFVYDAFGNRVARCTVSNCSAGEREINDGSQFVLARDGNNVVTDAYGFYPGGDQPMSLRLPSGQTGVFITDPQLRGTVRAIVDGNAQATNPEFKSYDIFPWGEVAADTGSITRLRMAGQQYDQGSELYYMRARYYDPALGRFLSEDPIGISGGLNLYAYAGNDPVNAMDRTGLCAVYDTPIPNVDDPSTDICVDNSAYGDHGGQLTGIPLPQLPKVSNEVPGLAGGGGPGGTETMGRGPAPSCNKLFVAVLQDAVLDFALPGVKEVVGGARLLARADRVAEAGREAFQLANGLLREGNAASAAIHEGNGVLQAIRGGAFGSGRIAGELSVGRGLAGWTVSAAMSPELLDLAATFLPGASTVISSVRWIRQCW